MLHSNKGQSSYGSSVKKLSFLQQTSCREREGAAVHCSSMFIFPYAMWTTLETITPPPPPHKKKEKKEFILGTGWWSVSVSKISILKRFGMKEGTMYYVMWGCRSRIIDCLGLKHPWFDIETEGRGRRESASFEPKQHNESGTKSLWFSDRFVAKIAPQVYVQRDVKKMQFRCEYQKVGIYWYLRNWPSHDQS